MEDQIGQCHALTEHVAEEVLLVPVDPFGPEHGGQVLLELLDMALDLVLGTGG